MSRIGALQARCDRCGQVMGVGAAEHGGWHLGAPSDFDVCAECLAEMDTERAVRNGGSDG